VWKGLAMSDFTVNLSEEVIQRYEILATLTGRDFNDLLDDAANYPLPDHNPAVYPPVDSLTEGELNELIAYQIPAADEARLNELNQMSNRSVEQEAERWALAEFFQINLLLKARALRDTIRRRREGGQAQP
jgi:hypothetical protein